MERKMKDSGIPWIGVIPEHWEASKIGQLYDNRYVRVSDKDFEPLSVTMQGILPQLETAAKTDDGDNRKLVRKGDFAINSRSDRRGSCGISPQDGSVSLINLILAPRTSMNADYYNWLFHTTLFADEFYSWGHGIVADLWTTRWQEMKNIAIPVPPLAEQEQIASYLDEKCGEIDELIDVEQQMISDLESYRQAIITEAVTHGLKPNSVMIDSDCDWFDSHPSNWHTEKIRNLFAKRSEKNNPIKTKERLSLSIDKGITLYADKTTNLDRFKDDFTQYQLAHPNDIVLNSMNMIVGAVGKSAYYGCVSPVYYVIYSKDANVNMDYYGYLLNIQIIRDVYHKLGQGIYAIERGDGRVNTCRLKVDYYEFCQIKVPVPPIDEQISIAKYLGQKNQEIDELIKVKQEKIETLKQYRQSLIFEAVSGKYIIS